MDFFLWGYVKDRVYAKKVNDIRTQDSAGSGFHHTRHNSQYLEYN
jgi:hypothetical protein